MTESQTLFGNLTHRRVPQIAGMYIAAMWLVIELGDWVTERFSMPGHLTSYVFVAMLVMLPGVLLVAYNHGAPGRDRWTRTEKIFVPINALITAVLLWLMTPLIEVEAATETLAIEDETGAIQQFEVVRRGFHRELVTFYWENRTGNAELDWLSYGLPIMLAHDINRVSPVITAITPGDELLLKNRLREQGHARLLGVQRGLAVELSREQESDAIVIGGFDEDGSQKIVSALVIDAASGDVLETYEGVASNWMNAVDAVTRAVLGIWEITPAENQSDDPVSEHLSGSLDAIRHYVLGQVAIDIDGDYPIGMTELGAALVIDPSFAEARSQLSVTQYQSGDLDAARDSATQALRNSYRLSTNSEFALKANRYVYDGDYDRGERVLQIWSQVQPNNTSALQNIAQFSRFRGTPESLERALLAYDRLLELRPNDYSVYLQKAEIEQQRRNYAAAIDLLERYLELVPDSSAAHGLLALQYQAQGKLDEAQAALEDAAILAGDPLEAELGLMRIEARRGLFAEAEARVQALGRDDLLPQQELQVLFAAAELSLTRGKVEQTRATYARANELAKNLMPPAARIIQIEAQNAALPLLVGRYEEAAANLDAVATQLQPPLSSYLNFIYSSIHAAAGNRDEFRRWARSSYEMREQLPELYRPIMALEQAQISIWDNELEAAIESVDSAKTMLGQSIIGSFIDSQSLAELSVNIAQLYLDAGATDKARQQLEDVLLVYPSYANAKFMLARVLRAEGDEESARRFLEDAIELWADADDDFIYRIRARALLAELGDGPA